MSPSMKEELKVWLVQNDTIWHAPAENRSEIEELIATEMGEADLIVLPEMWATGFTMQPEEVAEPMNLHSFKWMHQQAKMAQAAVVGSLAIKEKEGIYNRLLWMEPDGTYYTYDKRHLFRMAKEDEHYLPGRDRLIVKYKGWKLCPLICYDLRFPVFSRNQDLAYDALIYVANWPAKRVSSWDTLLAARAMENLSYCIGVNRVGTDGYEVEYNGHSAVYDPKGKALCFGEKHSQILKTHLSAAALQKFRDKFPAHRDADAFELK